MRIDSMDRLHAMKKTARQTSSITMTLYVCGGTSCLSSDSDLMTEMLKQTIEKLDLDATVAVKQVGCMLLCGEGPLLSIEPDGITYVKVRLEDVDTIVNQHVKDGNVVESLLYKSSNQHVYEKLESLDFYQRQHRIALRNVGKINPNVLEDYIALDGYQALADALLHKTPQDVINIIKQSGLRGRGGGGFPTGLKWEFTAAEDDTEKYVICNADEGDPGAFMDRSIIEGDPHALVEAMTIAGYAMGASTGYVYIRAEYAVSIEPLRKAIDDARKHGLIGQNIFGSTFNFDIEIKLGAGAFVCGEETALIRSLEGHRGEPDKKPPFPSESGFRGKPSCVNNVETLVNVPTIMREGAKWYASIGTKHSKGTKVFALAGHVKHVGLVEVPMGTTFKEIIFDIGGGHPDGKAIKAVQIGGPSGGVITEDYFDTPIDYGSLDEIGAMMGSGGMIVMDEESDMVDIAKFYLEFTQDESCGKCTPCRIGTKRMHEILERLTNMEGEPSDLQKLSALADNIKNASLCGLGQSAPNPVLSTMKFFREEYEAYAYRTKRTSYIIDAETCIGCTRCKRVCPVDCISGEAREPHRIDADACIACGACDEACPVDAVKRP